MSQTPEKLQLTSLNFTKVEKVEKVIKHSRLLQTDRKSKQNIKSPFMLILLLKKKIRTKIQQAFLKISLCKNKSNRQRLVANYIYSILKFKLKLNSAQSFVKLKNNSKKFKSMCKLLMSFSIWIKNKIKRNKAIGFSIIKLKNTFQNNKQSQQPLNIIEPKERSAKKRTDSLNKSVETGNKSMSASKIGLPYKVSNQQTQSEGIQLQKIRKQNEALKIMELSQEAREALKKVQRFDRVLYAQQTQKICKDVLIAELKRLQKIKNSHKQMRSQYYDNQLTITALHNHIKLIHQINKDLGDIVKFKEQYEKQEAKKRQQQFKLNLQSKRKGKPINLQSQIKNLMESAEMNLVKKDYEKAKQQINILITKYEKQQLLKDKLIFYKALLETISNGKDLQRCFEDINKFVTTLKNYDFMQVQNNLKLMKQSHKEYTQIVNKYLKQDKSFQKQTLNIIQALQITNNGLILAMEQFGQKLNRNNEDQIKMLKGQLQKSKLQLNNLITVKNEYDQINRVKKQFQKKTQGIFKKAEMKVDYKRDFQLLHKDKLFVEQKPYSDFFRLQKITEANYEALVQKQVQNIIIFTNQIITIYSKEKVKPEIRARDLSRFIQNSIKKNTNLAQLSNVINMLISTVIQKNQQQNQEKNKKLLELSLRSVQATQQKKRTKTGPAQNENIKQIKVKNSLSRQKIQIPKSQDKKRIQQLQKQINIYKEASKNMEHTEAKINNLMMKMQTNQDWITEIEIMKKERSNLANKHLQLVLNFYSKLGDAIKKINNLEVKTQNFLNSISRVLERKNLSNEKKLSQIQKLLQQSTKNQPFFASLFTILVQHFKQGLNNNELQKQQSQKVTQKQTISKDKVKQLSTENQKLIASIQSERSKSNSLNLKIKQLQKASRQITKKITSLEKQKKEFTQARMPNKNHQIVLQQNIRLYQSKIIQFISKIQTQIQSKQFLNNAQSPNSIKDGLTLKDTMQLSIANLIIRLGLITKTKLQQERKQNAKTIKSYENELEKMNTLVSQFQIKLKEKDLQYQQLLQTVTQSQKATTLKQSFKSPSLRASRKSMRSNSSQKKSDINNIKASIEAFAEDQRNMLQKLNQSENQKLYLVQKIKSLELEIFQNQHSLQQLHIQIASLQKKSQLDHEYFQMEYKNWRQKQVQTGKSLEELNIQIQKQLIRKQQQLKLKFAALVTQKQQMLYEQQNTFLRTQNEQSNQIILLKEKLRLVNAQLVNKQNLFDNKDPSIEAQLAILRAKVSQYQIKMTSAGQASFQLQALIKQNGKMQADLSHLTLKNKLLQLQIESNKIIIKQLSQNKMQKDTSTNSKESERIKQLQQLVTQLKQEQQKIIKHEINLALKHQQDDFNRFLVKHDEQIEQHFFTIIIPQKIKQFELQMNKNYQQLNNRMAENNSSNSSMLQKQLNDQINQLRNNNKQLKQQYEQQYRVTVQTQSKLHEHLRMTEDLQRKFEQQLQRNKNSISQLQRNNKRNWEIQQNIRKYLHSLQISYQEAASGILSENVSTLYNRANTEQKIVEIKQKAVPDPKQQATINELRVKVDQQMRIIKDLQLKLNTQHNQVLKLMHSSKAVTINASPQYNLNEYKVLEENLKRLQQNFEDLNKKYIVELSNSRSLEVQLHQKKTIQDSLKHEIRRIESAWQSKLYDQNISYERKLIQISNQRNTQLLQQKPIQEFKILEAKVQQISNKYNNEMKIKFQLENKCKQLIQILDTKVAESQSQSFAQITKLNNQIVIQKSQNDILNQKLNQKDKQIKFVEDGLRRQIKQADALWGKRMQEKNNYYQRRISDLMTQISNNKMNYKVELNNFNHIECQNKYFNLESASNKQIQGLKSKINGLNEMLRKNNEQIGMLRQLVNSQQIEIKQLQVATNDIKKSKNQIQRQKQSCYNDYNLKLIEKQRQVFKIKSEYESKISLLFIEKEVLQSKLNQTLQNSRHPFVPQKIVDNNYLRVIELESLLNTKMAQIKRLQDLNEKRKQDFETEFSKLINIERQKQTLRNNCHLFQTQVLRLEYDLNHLNNQMKKYKQLLTQSQNRQQLLRDALTKTKSQNQEQYHIFLKQGDANQIKNDKKIVQSRFQTHYRSEYLTNINQMINQRQNQNFTQKSVNNQIELETLMRINQQVTELVSTNRQLQTKCALLQSQLEVGDKFFEKINFFMEMQDKIEILVNFLIEKSMINNVEMYNTFLQNSNECLNTQNVFEYFSNFLHFMKLLFSIVSQNKSDELKQKAEQLLELKQQMNRILDKHLQFAEDSSYQTLDKYKMIFSDIKILLKQYMSSKNQQYIQMIWRSLDTSGV